MTNDDFTEAARAEAEAVMSEARERVGITVQEQTRYVEGHVAGAEWARTHLFEELLTKRWVCQVARSGYHNGASCRPDDAHDGWGCGYYYEASIRATEYEEKLS